MARLALLSSLLIAALLSNPVRVLADAADSSAVTVAPDALRHRWGVGWDGGIGFIGGGGIAVRYRIDHSWGLGAIITTSVSGGDDEGDDRDSSTESDYESVEGTVSTSDFTSDSYSLRGFAFHETRLADWFTMGPYFGMGYGYRRYESDAVSVSTRLTDSQISIERRQSTSTSTDHEWAFSVGLRPSFTFDKRFTLETRLGITAIWTDSSGSSTSRRTVTSGTEGEVFETRESVDRDRDDDDGWRLNAFGEDLGPGAVLAFIVSF
ncbi:MAG: hypothetical protein ACKVU1_12085 [bacterium]